MKPSSSLLIFISILLVFVLKLAFTNAATLSREESMMESDENDASLRSKKETALSLGQQFIPSPQRRHHLKFGVLGKRYAYGYLGKRNNEEINNNYDDWLNDMRERRAGRPQYGMLG